MHVGQREEAGRQVFCFESSSIQNEAAGRHLRAWFPCFAHHDYIDWISNYTSFHKVFLCSSNFHFPLRFWKADVTTHMVRGWEIEGLLQSLSFQKEFGGQNLGTILCVFSGTLSKSVTSLDVLLLTIGRSPGEEADSYEVFSKWNSVNRIPLSNREPYSDISKYILCNKDSFSLAFFLLCL